MDPEIENLVREAERLIAEVESGGFESWCSQMGFDPGKFRSQLDKVASSESESRARELFADDMAEINREVESRAADLGIVRDVETPRSSAVRQRRRMGMV